MTPQPAPTHFVSDSLQEGQAWSHGSNFDALKIYIRNQQQPSVVPAPSPMQVSTLAPSPMQVTTLAVSDATLLNDIEWAVVDVETTGLSFKWCRVIDVAVEVLGKDGCRGFIDGGSNASGHDARLHTALQTLVNPLPLYLVKSSSSSPVLPPVPKRILELTGITREVTYLHRVVFSLVTLTCRAAAVDGAIVRSSRH
jgi:hypothetical protein